MGEGRSGEPPPAELDALGRPIPDLPEPDPDEPDWIIEAGLFVATRSGLLRRGYCCGSGCRNCPWSHRGPR